MDHDHPIHLSSSGSAETDDPILERLEEDLQRSVRNALPFNVDSDDPFDLEVAKPRALSLRRLYEQIDREIPPALTASLGPRVPILLCHGMTPFYKPGGRPVGVWGMGYEVSLEGADGATVALFPESRLLDVARAEQQATFGVSAGGEMGVPPDGLKLFNQVPGIAMTGAKLFATSHQAFALAVDCSISLVEIQAGPVNAGGARWNLYRARKRIDVFQPLFQTILIPSDVTSLNMTVSTWIRRSGSYFSWGRTREWLYPPQQFKISLAGLPP